MLNRIAEKADINSSPLNPKKRGSISGIDDTNFTPGHLIIGVLYGMAEELKSYFEDIGRKDMNHIVAAGNAVKKNPVLQKILGKTFRSSIALTTNNEEAAFGSALFAGVSCGRIDLSAVKDIIQEMDEGEKQINGK